MRTARTSPLLLALAIGLVFSLRWIYPLARDPGFTLPNLEGEDYYVYYARMRKFIDARPFDFDQSIYEDRHHVSIHSSYALSLFFGSVGGWLTGRTEHAYYFNYLVYPTIGFLLVFFFIGRLGVPPPGTALAATLAVFLGLFFLNTPWLYYLTPTKGLSLLGRFHHALDAHPADLLGLTALARGPSLLISNVHLFFFAVLLLTAIQANRPLRRGHAIALALALGLASLMTSANFLLCHSIFVISWIFHPRARRTLTPIFLVAVILSLPGVWLNLKAIPLYPDVQTMTMLDPSSSWQRWGHEFFLGVLYLAIPLILIALAKPAEWRFAAAIYAGTLASFVFVYWRNGPAFSGRIVSNGAEILLGATALAAIGSLATRHGARRLSPRGRRAMAIACSLSAFALVTVVAMNQWRLRDRYRANYEPTFNELADWSRTAPRPAVALTLDAHLILDLGTFSPFYQYIGQALMSSASESVRWGRLYDVARFHGMTSEDFARFVGRMPAFSHFTRMFDNLRPSETPPAARAEEQAAAMTFILFYGRFFNDPPSANVIARMREGYARALGDPTPLKFRADYLVVSRETESWIRPDSPAARVVASQPPDFRNADYAVYRISGAK